MLNIFQTVTSPVDLERLQEVTAGTIGEKCWKAYLGYADELILQIGARIPYLSPKLIGKEHGTWTLRTRDTSWKLETTNQVLTTSEDNLASIKQKIQLINDANVATFEVAYPDLALTISFSNDCTLKVLPKPEDDNFDLAYWDLFCPPDRSILEVGPNSIWSYTKRGRP